jgi:hypothetical protein
MTATIAVTVLAGLLAVGVAGYESWLASLRLVGWAGHPLNASLRGLLTRGLTVPTLTEQPTSPVIVAPAWLDPAWLVAVAAVIAVGVRQIVVTRSVDVAWATLTLSALLVSPLGWVHYVPIATGPLVAVLVAGRPGAMQLAAVGVALLCVPFAWLKATIFGPALTLTFASSYTWGLLLLLASTINATRGAPPKS